MHKKYEGNIYEENKRQQDWKAWQHREKRNGCLQQNEKRGKEEGILVNWLAVGGIRYITE